MRIAVTNRHSVVLFEKGMRQAYGCRIRLRHAISMRTSFWYVSVLSYLITCRYAACGPHVDLLRIAATVSSRKQRH